MGTAAKLQQKVNHSNSTLVFGGYCSIFSSSSWPFIFAPTEYLRLKLKHRLHSKHLI